MGKQAKMKQHPQIQTATTLGRLGYLAGRQAPAQDAAVLHMIAGRRVGETPEGEAPTTAILKAWSAGFHLENIANAWCAAMTAAAQREQAAA